MFNCPVCSSALTRTPGPRGIVWVCGNCGGRAINVSLLRRLVDQQHFNRLWQTAWHGETRTDRKCPSCQKPMTEVPLNPPPDPLVLDACKSCQFVWFDGSELEKIPPAKPEPAPKDPLQTLPLEARQKIAEQKVREMAAQAEGEHEKMAVAQSFADVLPWLIELLRD